MNILIADDHSIVRKGLIELLKDEFPELEIHEAVNSAEVLELAGRRQFDVILLDISMPGRNGIDTLKQLRSQGVKTPILMLSMHPEDQYAVRALKAGASGFVNKESANDELLTAVHKILSGKKYISPSAAEHLLEGESKSGKSSVGLLSDRELDVLRKIASGKTVSEIAQELSLSVNTISTYRSRILEKLNLHNNAEITRYAFDNGLT